MSIQTCQPSGSNRNKQRFLLGLLLSCLLGSYDTVAQLRTIQFEQLDSLQKTDERPVVVFLHTSWCTWCGAMKNTTLKSRDVQAQLNERYYFLFLDIEEKKTITIRGRTFRFQPTGVNTGVHELAEQLGTINGQLAYPGICILNSHFEILYQQEGYMKEKDFMELLKKIRK